MHHPIINDLRDQKFLAAEVKDAAIMREQEELGSILASDDADSLQEFRINPKTAKWAQRQAAKLGALKCLRLLHSQSGEFTWDSFVPQFAAAGGHTHVLEWVMNETGLLSNGGQANETACYGIEVGHNSAAAKWLWDHNLVRGDVIFQSAARSGDTTVFMGIYNHVQQNVISEDLAACLDAAFPFVWHNVINLRHEAMKEMVSLLVSLTTPAQEAKWRRDAAKYEKKRMRLTSILDHSAVHPDYETVSKMPFRFTTVKDVNAAFESGSRMAQWRRLGKDEKRSLVEETLGQEEPESSTDYIVQKVDDFLTY